MNQTLKDISERYSCRKFTGEMPEDEKIQAIAQAAIQSPSSGNHQPWQIIVLRNKELLDEFEVESTEGIGFSPKHKKAYDVIKSKGIKVYYNAPCLIIITKEQNNPEAELDCGIVSQTIAVAAQSLGLASLISGIPPMVHHTDKSDYFREKLHIPDGHDIAVGVLVGIAEKQGTPHKPNPDKVTYID